MNGLRSDIAAAVSRMRLTFGTRTAIRNLPESCESGEVVECLVACTYDMSEGLLVLTDRRVMAIRDDFSRFRLQHVPLGDVRAVDYDPIVHDGLAVLTAQSRIAVRRMVRADSDAFVQALTDRVPGLVHGVSRPGQRTEIAAQAPAVPGVVAAGVDTPTPAFGASTAPSRTAAAVESAAGPTATSVTGDAPRAMSAAVATEQADDTDVLLGVLADLHAKGLLTAEELTAKIAQLTTRS